MTAGEHWIVVIPETEDTDPDYRIECGGVTEACRTWFECQDCEPTEVELEGPEFLRHGKRHRSIEGAVCIPSDRCILHELDASDDASHIVLCGDGGHPMPAGRYPLAIDDTEGETAYVSLLSSTDRTAAALFS